MNIASSTHTCVNSNLNGRLFCSLKPQHQPLVIPPWVSLMWRQALEFCCLPCQRRPPTLLSIPMPPRWSPFNPPLPSIIAHPRRRHYQPLLFHVPLHLRQNHFRPPKLSHQQMSLTLTCHQFLRKYLPSHCWPVATLHRWKAPSQLLLKTHSHNPPNHQWSHHSIDLLLISWGRIHIA